MISYMLFSKVEYEKGIVRMFFVSHIIENFMLFNIISPEVGSLSEINVWVVCIQFYAFVYLRLSQINILTNAS